jgi:hypothetical protein
MFNTASAPQISVDSKIHKTIKAYAKVKGLVLHAATNEILLAGMKAKRIKLLEASADNSEILSGQSS